MRCPKCDEEVPEGNKFCGNCGATIDADDVEKEPAAEAEREPAVEVEREPAAEERAPEPPRPAPTEPAPPPPVEPTPRPDRSPEQEAPVQAMAPTDTTDTLGEREVWRGRFSNRAALGGLLVTFSIALVLVLLATLAEFKVGPRWLRTTIWIIAAAVVAAVLVRVLWRWAKYRFTLRYRLTTERLFIDKGLFSRTRDEIELIRVDDVRVKQSLMDRFFKVGQVRIISTDRTHAELVLLGIDEPDGVKEKVRQYMRARRKKSLHIESL